MNYPLRSIAYIAELIHPPANHNAADLQKLHSVAFADQICQYQNFQMLPQGAQMSNPPGQSRSVSCCTFLGDRIQIREEMTGISREDYENRLQRIAFLAMTHLKLQVFIVQQFVVRTLVNSKFFVDSREFISQGIFNMESDNFAPLDRKQDILGLRFALSKGDQKEGLFNLRIESFSQDPRSIFIENIGTYRTMVRKDNLEGLTDNFGKTYAYVETNVVPFLAQFDDAP